MISEFKMNNEHIFVEKVQAPKEEKELSMWSQSIGAEISQVCNLVLELHIPKDVETSKKH